ncbi:MAG: hypothetical protein ACJ0BG_00605 [Dehalococcoidia bacterium]
MVFDPVEDSVEEVLLSLLDFESAEFSDLVSEVDSLAGVSDEEVPELFPEELPFLP